MNSKTILITGGSGLIGSRLTELLLKKGYNVNWLSRKKGKKGDVSIYNWNYQTGDIDAEAITTADYIIHLAGASVADKRWTNDYKKEIIESRTKSAELLFEKVSQIKPELKAFISSSAIGIYGSDRGEELLRENSRYGQDYIAEVTKQWEESADLFTKIKIRTVKIRVGIVLSDKGGALEKMAQPIKLGVGAALGSGNQMVPWIHIDDICEIFIKAIEDENLSGPYNGVAPNPVTNKELTKAIATTLHKKIILPNVPGFALKFALGEMASSVLGGLKVSAEKIQSTGFIHKYPKIEDALKALYSES